MANKSFHYAESFEFHPCDTPRGMEFYDLSCLTRVQQQRLINHKIEVVRENQKFLYKNPEIRAYIQIIMRKILLERPSHDIQRFIGTYFYNNWQSINEDVRKYVATLPRKPILAESKVQIKEDKHVIVEDDFDESSESTGVSIEEHLTHTIVKEILEEMLDKVHEHHQQKKVKTSLAVQVIDDDHRRISERSDDEDDELIFDLGLDFELDFSAYHEDNASINTETDIANDTRDSTMTV